MKVVPYISTDRTSCIHLHRCQRNKLPPYSHNFQWGFWWSLRLALNVPALLPQSFHVKKRKKPVGFGCVTKNTKKQKHKKSLFRREDERSSNRSRSHAVHHVLQVCVDHANTTKARYEIARVERTDPSPEYVPPYTRRSARTLPEQDGPAPK